ncbi:sigma-70 family RNA polymerase sigma factor [Stenotrophomonas sp. STM01]|jgi:RNA polymerase sigma factor (TIGR02999 family)|uniref:ECF-type sigma factor n=1 Tax=unclassified Stenotrophomonas TaxID=196198 RepID=UPI001784A525|nr:MULTISPECIES: ECF-type sigma factor [unclassified Stenotrophomonas]MBD9535620.1 sigma-70 family RNA polymerase sigma factor [Stenotrophomonas sp. STM01]
MEADDYEVEIGQRLESLLGGREVDLSQLMTDMQGELRQIARYRRRRGAVGETLSTTALINEAYLRFAASPELFQHIDRNHFLAIAARAMRNIVINHARDRVAQKRGSGVRHETLGQVEVMQADLDEAEQLLELNDALERLEKLRPRLARVVQLRYFAGLSEEETGEVLEIDRSTVRRDWLKARGWLYERLHPDA